MAGSNRKKKRTPKTSKGINGASRHPLSEVERVLIGKGVVQRLKHVAMPNGKNWSGIFRAPDDAHKFDAEQARINEETLPFLFGGE